MSEPAVSAIVLNYNGLGFATEAVASLLDQECPGGLEVLVVDNGSSDGSDAELEGRFGSAVRMLRNGRNLGWGAGNNVGIRSSRGRCLVLLNNDAVAAPGFVRELLAAAAATPKTGMVAAKVLDYERREVIDTVGHLLSRDGLNRGRGRLETDRGQYDSRSTALFPSGAAGLYARAMLDEVGLFDESFFLYGDDAELGLRGRLAGWGCGFAPRAVAYHRYSRSAGAYSSLKAFHVERNRIWLLLKLFPAPLIATSPAFTLARLALSAWGSLRGRGAAARLRQQRSFAHLVALTLRAWASAALGAFRVLGERRRVVRRLGAREFRSLLSEFTLDAREAALKD